MAGNVFIISAPSGSGKSTLVNEIRKHIPGLEFSISYTTRPPRGSERHGIEYFFVTREDFDRMAREGEFLEHAEVFGNCYGTSTHFYREAIELGRDLLLDIDVQGGKQVKQKIPEAVSVFVLPPSREILETRLRKRSKAELDSKDGGKTAEDERRAEDVIARRLSEAGREIENYPEYDYILVNENLETAVEQLSAIVEAERMRRSGKPLTGDREKILSIAEQCLKERAEPRIQSILSTFAGTSSGRSSR